MGQQGDDKEVHVEKSLKIEGTRTLGSNSGKRLPGSTEENTRAHSLSILSTNVSSNPICCNNFALWVASPPLAATTVVILLSHVTSGDTIVPSMLNDSVEPQQF